MFVCVSHYNVDNLNHSVNWWYRSFPEQLSSTS